MNDFREWMRALAISFVVAVIGMGIVAALSKALTAVLEAL